MVAEADYTEYEGEDGKTSDLDRTTADRVHEDNGEPVTRQRAGADKNKVSDGGVEKGVVDTSRARAITYQR